VGGACGMHRRGEKMVRRFEGESPKEREHSDDRGVDGRTVLEWLLGRLVGAAWGGFTWLRIGTGGGLL
jgi:hypothetical protein